MPYNFETSGNLQGYGAAIGTGQSVLETLKEMNRDKQQSRVLAAQIENQMMQTRMSALERQAERELRLKELELKDREAKSLEEQRKRFDLGGGQIAYRYDENGQAIPITPQTPYNPRSDVDLKKQEASKKAKNDFIGYLRIGYYPSKDVSGNQVNQKIENQNDAYILGQSLGVDFADPEIKQLVTMKPTGTTPETGWGPWKKGGEQLGSPYGELIGNSAQASQEQTPAPIQPPIQLKRNAIGSVMVDRNGVKRIKTANGWEIYTGK
jgi:hypothetical protein